MPKSTRVNFTNGRVNDYSCPAGKRTVFYWDSGAPGLGIRVTVGAKSYIYQGTLPTGNKVRVTLGSVGALTLEKGRELARNHAGKVAAGIDPRKERKERAAAIEAAEALEIQRSVKLSEVWPVYIEANKHRWSARYLLDHERMIEPGGRKAKRTGKGKTIKPGPLAALAPMKLTEIGTETVKLWLKQEVATRPTQAHIAFGLLRTFLNWCSDHPDYSDAVIPEACGRRIKRMCLPPKKAKNDCMQREQLSKWFEEVGKLYNPIVSAYLQGLLLTGARRNELASLTWKNVDFKWRSLTIHDKVDGERTIPLTSYLAVLLYALPRRNQYVFSSPNQKSKTGYLSDPRRAHGRACAAAGIEGLTLHGLRRSFGTLSEWVETPVGVVAQIQGHKPSAIAEKHYRCRPLDLLRMWHVKIEGWILEQAGIPQPAKDVELGKLRAV